MNPTSRTTALLVCALSLAEDLKKSEDKKVKWRAVHMHKAAFNAVNFYPNTGVRDGYVKNITHAASKLKSSFSGGGDKLPMAMATLLCGTDDVLSHSKNKKTIQLFRDLEKKLMWMNGLVDSKFDKFGDYIRGEHNYLSWKRSLA